MGGPRRKQVFSQAAVVVEKKAVLGKKEVGEWLRLFQDLAQWDVQAEAAARRYRTRMLVAFVAAAVLGASSCMFCSALAAGGNWAAFIVLAAIFAGLVTMGIRSLRRMQALERQDLDDNFRKVFLPVFADLSEDVAPGAQVFVRLDLSGLSDKKILSRRRVASRRFKKLVLTDYDSPWATVRLPLVDGSVLELDFRDRVRKEDRFWTNLRGKTKHKVKFRTLSRVLVRLLPPSPGAVWDQDAAWSLAQQGVAIKIRRKGDLFVCSLALKKKLKTVGEPPGTLFAPEEVIGAVLTVFRLLRRKGAPRGGSHVQPGQPEMPGPSGTPRIA